MNTERYNELSDKLTRTAFEIECAKRPAYTLGNEDVLHNFKSVAARIGITPMQTWAVYWLKHVDAISAYAKNPKAPQAEALIGRFADNLNYLKLGFALMSEVASEKDS